LSGSNSVTINLTNVNEAPVVTAATFSLAENSANGTAVGTVTATDPDAGTTLTYSITGGNTGGAFAINAATGAITVATSAALNFETTPSFSLTVTATDNGTPVLSGSNTITINLTNVNEAPVVNDQTFTVSSNAVNGAVVGTIAATDPDAGTTLAYSITGGNAGGAFALNGATGQITVASAAALVGVSSFALNVTVSDNGTPTLSDTAVITVNVTLVNQPPVVNDQTFTVAENTTNGTVVGTIVSTDPDGSQTRTISVTGGSGQTVFAVSAAGVITVANSTALNFEITPSFTLNVTITDNGTPALSDTAIITINLTNVNESPVVTAATFSLAENSANGTAVGTVTATDPDAATTLTYSITGGNTGGAFAINAATGAITVATSAALNFETTPSFSLTVTATDNGTPVLSGSNTITINLTNVNEAPVVTAATFSLAENSANGTAVGTVTATDPDAGTTLTYSITGGNTGGAFAINAATGAITVATSAALNFETTPSFSLTVTATDNGTPALSGSNTITINLTNVNEAPVVNDQTFTVSGNAVNGAVVGTIAAADPDAATTLAYSITGGNTGGAFALNGATGQITVASAAALAGVSSFALNVTVSDNGTPALSDTAVITINVVNVNQAPVVNDQTFTLAENTANGTTVGTILSTDADAGQTRTVSVTGGTGQTVFAVSAAGVITVANNTALNFETTPSFTLNVTVTDSGTPALSDTAIITINLTNVNEAPVITSNGAGNTASISVPENSSAVTTVTAEDPDAGAALTFTLTGADAAKFQLTGTGTSRVLSFITPPDFESPTDVGTNNVYDVSVQVSDGLLNDSQALAVTVTNVIENNNNPPVAQNDTVTTALHTPIVIDVLANDTDEGPLVPSSVKIGTEPANGSVSVNSTTGKITYTPDLGFFGTDTFTYSVKDGTGLVSNFATVTVNVQHDSSKPFAQLMTDPLKPNKTVLVVLGTDGNDEIRFTDLRQNGIRVTVNGKVLGTYKPTNRIVAFGLNGNDEIDVDDKIHLSAELYGNAGNDALEGGSGKDFLDGGSGNDILFGEKGNDQLVGGTGNDLLIGGKGRDQADGGPGRDLSVSAISTNALDIGFARRLFHWFESWF
jgi:hypothetical protein